MVTEDYVSFETAKLLKEKEFDETNCHTCYKYNGGFCKNRKSMSGVDTMISYQAPTLEMVRKWLREKYNLYVDVGYDDLDWFWNIINVSPDIPVEERPKFVYNGTALHKSYEEASECGINYCLTNLI